MSTPFPGRRSRNVALASPLLAGVLAACGATGASTTTIAETTPAPPSIIVTTTTVAPTTNSPTTTVPLSLLQGLVLTPIAASLGQPVAGAPLPGSQKLIVLDRQGRVLTVDLTDSSVEVALDVGDLLASGSWERGLLGLAVHPDFENNQRVLLTYTGKPDGTLILAEVLATGTDPLVLDRSSLRTLLEVEQPGTSHQGGTLAFDEDGLLWIALGDGGSPPLADGTFEQDAFGWARDPHRVQGTLIRIDVDGGDPYAIPTDNPFADGQQGAPEVWGYGFRNPWGMSFDDGRVFVADVGHIRWEEIDVVDIARGAGSDFGWSMWEGPECFEDNPCATVESILPSLATKRPDFCALIGGRVYRGTAIPELVGDYFFSDLCSGRIRSVVVEGTEFFDQTEWIAPEDSVPQITAFIEGANGELYVIDFLGGLRRIDPVR